MPHLDFQIYILVDLGIKAFSLKPLKL